MSVADDVGNLFRRFGGDAGQYQEVARDDDAKHAALRWPLLNALDIAHPEPVPGAGRAAPSAASPDAGLQPQTAPAHIKQDGWVRRRNVEARRGCPHARSAASAARAANPIYASA